MKQSTFFLGGEKRKAREVMLKIWMEFPDAAWSVTPVNESRFSAIHASALGED